MVQSGRRRLRSGMAITDVEGCKAALVAEMSRHLRELTALFAEVLDHWLDAEAGLQERSGCADGLDGRLAKASRKYRRRWKEITGIEVPE